MSRGTSRPLEVEWGLWGGPWPLDPGLTRLPGPHTPIWGVSFPICEMGPLFLISGLYSVLRGAMAHLGRGVGMPSRWDSSCH